MFGLDALADAAEVVAARDRTAAAAYERFSRLGSRIAARGACAHPDGAVRLLLSALDVFADELAEHVSGRCSGRLGRPVLPVPSTPAAWR